MTSFNMLRIVRPAIVGFLWVPAGSGLGRTDQPRVETDVGCWGQGGGDGENMWVEGQVTPLLGSALLPLGCVSLRESLPLSGP